MSNKSLVERLRASPTSDIMIEAADYIDGLISQHHRDSKELRRLCAERDEARQSALDRGFALLKAQKEARALLAERDALREALRWSAAALQAACRTVYPSDEGDQIVMDNEFRTVGQILDGADAALTQQEHTNVD